MNVKQSFILALKSIQSSKMRSALTMLGIIIGVAAVIILVSIVGGFSNTLTGEFESMGVNLITVSIRELSSSRSVSGEDIDVFVRENGALYSAYSPVVSMSGAKLRLAGEELSTTCTGVGELYDKIEDIEIASGRFLKYTDVEERSKVCVIGSYIESERFDGADPLGKSVKINGNEFTVVGVLAEKADSGEGSDDDCAYIPCSTAARLLGMKNISSYYFSAASSETMGEAVDKIEDMLYKALGSEDAYYVFNSSTLLDMLNELMGTLSAVLVGIAGISLLVGGIGIMNIMIVSVTERTREIGIRMSVGAKERDILRQFLIEAATTSATGGVIGIILGIAAAYPLSGLIGVEASISPEAVLTAFSVSVGIGIVFGYFPARKASRMNPIDALRYE